MLTPSDWMIQPDAAEADVLPLLEQDRIWNCFAIADLSPPYREFSRYAVARREEEAAVVFRFFAPHLRVVSAWGRRQGIAALLDVVRPPGGVFVQCLAEHRAIFDPHETTVWDETIRMSASAAIIRPSDGTVPAGLRLERLSRDHLVELTSLYGPMGRGGFPESQIDEGVFFGIISRAGLVATAGTHIVAADRGIGVIGGVLTRADHRRRGLARLTTLAVAEHLLAAGCRDVVLNVGAQNAGAIALYDSLGFRRHSRFYVGRAAPGGLLA